MLFALPLSLETLRESNPVLVALTFFIPLVGGIFLFFYKTRHVRLWRKGIFPPKLKPNEDNFLEAYLALGAKMMIMDYHASKGKIKFINQYFSRYFKFANYNFGDSLVFSFKNPIQSQTVTDWMKKHIPSEGGRSQIIYFLAGLGMVNGNLTSKELAFLKTINKELGLDNSNLTRILSIYASYYQKSTKDDKSSSKRQTNKYAYEILGVSTNATKTEIKKAYRKLAKVHHPDNFANSSASQQKMAEEKFIEIQGAYELLYEK